MQLPPNTPRALGVLVLGTLLFAGIINGDKSTATTAATEATTPVVPTGPFKSVDAQYLVNMSKHGTDAHDVEFIASCKRAPWKDWAVDCTEISDGGLFVNVVGQSVSGSTAQLDQCKQLGQSGCAFKVRFTFKGGYRQDVLIKEADTTVPRMVVSAKHVIIEAIN